MIEPCVSLVLQYAIVVNTKKEARANLKAHDSASLCFAILADILRDHASHMANTESN